MSADVLEALAGRLFRILQSSFLSRPKWVGVKASLETLAQCLSKYCEGLREKTKTMKLVHGSSTPWHTLSKGLDLFYLKPTTNVTLKEIACLNTKLVQAGPYSFLELDKHVPCDQKKRYHGISSRRSKMV